MADKTLIFKKLVLEGFGPYHQATEFTFQPGLNLFIAPNETGKSTMAAGISATIFGLFHRQAADESLARYRNWAGPLTCRAELTFSLAGQDYRIRRNFDNHDIAFIQLNGVNKSDQVLISGQHNPAASKRLQLYEEKLAEIFGINDRELFAETFFVRQPLPEAEKLSDAVRQLLTGAGSGSFQVGLDRLLAQLRLMTKYLGPNHRAVSSRNLSKDGRLERITARLERLTEKISRGQATADEYLAVQARLAQLDRELAQNRTLQEQKKAAAAAWHNWQAASAKYSRAAQNKDRLKAAWHQLTGLVREETELTGQLAKDYTGWPVQIKTQAVLEDLQELIRLTGAASQLQAEQAGLAAELGQKKQLEKELKAELLANWPQPEQDPVKKAATLVNQAADFKKSWQQLLKIEDQLQKDYGLLAEANAEELALLDNYQLRQENLEQAARQTQTEVAVWQNRQESYGHKQKELAASWADISQLPSSAAAAAQAKLQLNQDKASWQKISAAGKKQQRLVLVAGLAGFLSLGLVYYLVASSFNWPGFSLAGLAGAVLAAGLTFLAAYKRLQNGAAARRQLLDLAAKLTALDQQLGSFSKASDLELVRLSERLASYQANMQQLAAEAAVLAGIDLAALADQARQKEQALASFLARTAQFTKEYPDLDQALVSWQSLTSAKQALELEIKGLLAHQELTAYFELWGFKPAARAEQLAQTLQDLPPGWWQELAQKAARSAACQAELTELAGQLRSGALLLQATKAKLESLQESKEGLELELAFILEAWQHDPVLALTAAKSRQELQGRQKELAGQKKTLLAGLQLADAAELEASLSLAGDEALLALGAWQELILQNPGLPQPGQIVELSLIQQDLARRQKELALLDEELDLQAQEQRDLHLQLARLEGQEPVNLAVAELELAELRQRKAELELKADALETAFKELDGATAEFGQTYKQRLASQASLYVNQIAWDRQRQIDFSDQLEISVLEDGYQAVPANLSKGARDQIYLAVRFAIADLLAGDVRLPLILDDPFQSSDAKRRARIRAILDNQAQKRQIFIMSHNRADYGGWGKDIVINSLL